MLKTYLQNIFSIKNDNIHKVITICGIKLKIFSKKLALKTLNKQKKCYEQNAEYFNVLSYLWRTIDLNDILSNYYENRYKLNYKRYSQNDFRTYLIFINSLLLCNKKNFAKEILQDYYKKIGLKGIEQSLAVANFAYRLGYSNDIIEKASFIYEEFNKNKQQNSFEKFIKNKSIAIVGNGPYELGKNKGKEIDNHDIVIRMNNYQTLGFEKDYGTKTDIYARGVSNDVQPKDFQQFKMIIIPLDLDNYLLSQHPQFINYIYDAVQNNISIYSSCRSTKSILKKIFPNLNPTTGFNIIWEIYHILGSFENVDFYGFNFMTKTQDNYTAHYFNDRSEAESKAKSSTHNMKEESVILKEFINNVKSHNRGVKNVI